MEIKPSKHGSLLGALCAGLLFGAVYPLGLLEPLQNTLQDRIAQFRYARDPLPPGHDALLLINFDDKAYYESGERWPWDRASFAEVIRRVAAGEPAAILFDMLPTGKTNPQSDAALAGAIAEAGNVILGAYLDPNGAWVQPESEFAEAAAAVGAVNHRRSSDFRMRSTRMVITPPLLQTPFFSVAAEIEALSHNWAITRYGNHVRFVDADGSIAKQVPMHGDGLMKVRYPLTQRQIESIPVMDLLQGNYDPSRIAGKIVLVGATGYIYHDIHPTPLGAMPGVVVIANAYLTLRNNAVPVTLPLFPQWLFIFAAVLTAAWASYRYSAARVFLGLAAFYFLMALGSILLDYRNIHWDLVAAPIGTLLVFIIAVVHRNLALTLEMMQLRVLATMDPLTGVSNVRYMQVRMEHEIARVDRYDTNFSVILFDVDDFKHVNDAYGHAKGNEVLLKITDILKRRARKADLIGRLGGDEFCAVLFETDTEGAATFCKYFLEEIRRCMFFSGASSFSVSLSIGIASMTKGRSLTWEKLLEQADTAAYESKKSGKNRYSIYREPGDISAAG